MNLIMYAYSGVKMDLGNFARGFSASYAELVLRIYLKPFNLITFDL